MKSTLRSPDSDFEMNDCGRESSLATSAWVRPASSLACFRRFKNSLYSRMYSLVFGGRLEDYEAAFTGPYINIQNRILRTLRSGYIIPACEPHCQRVATRFPMLSETWPGCSCWHRPWTEGWNESTEGDSSCPDADRSQHHRTISSGQG
jgi:hypothetical protein